MSVKTATFTASGPCAGRRRGANARPARPSLGCPRARIWLRPRPRVAWSIGYRPYSKVPCLNGSKLAAGAPALGARVSVPSGSYLLVAIPVRAKHTYIRSLPRIAAGRPGGASHGHARAGFRFLRPAARLARASAARSPVRSSSAGRVFPARESFRLAARCRLIRGSRRSR